MAETRDERRETGKALSPFLPPGERVGDRGRRVRVPFAVGLACLILWSACDRKPKETYLAKVGDHGLSQSEVLSMVPEAYRDQITPTQTAMLVTQWVDDELLYQDAVNKNLPQDPELQARIAIVTRKMVVERYLEKEVESSVKVTDSMIYAYWDGHRSEFERTRDEWRVIRFVSDQSLPLDEIKRRILAGDQVKDIFASYLDPASGVRPEDMGYIPPIQIPASARKLTDKAKIGSPVGPVMGDDGAVLYVILDRSARGNVRKLDEVSESIRGQLESALRDSLTEDALKEIKARVPVTIDPKVQLGGN